MTGGENMGLWIDDGLIGSVCRKCKNWIFNDWYLCNEFVNCDDNGFIILPVKECKNFRPSRKGVVI